MAYVPQRIVYAEIASLAQLSYPRDRWRIALLSQSAKEMWYATRSPTELIYESQSFRAFWYRYYIWPLRVKRFFYGFKFW